MEFGKAQKSPQHQTVIIFDWDDTLLCTSFLNLRNQAGQDTDKDRQNYSLKDSFHFFFYISHHFCMFSTFCLRALNATRFRSRCSPQPSNGISGSKSELGAPKTPPRRAVVGVQGHRSRVQEAPGIGQTNGQRKMSRFFWMQDCLVLPLLFPQIFSAIEIKFFPIIRWKFIKVSS